MKVTYITYLYVSIYLSTYIYRYTYIKQNQTTKQKRRKVGET